MKNENNHTSERTEVYSGTIIQVELVRGLLEREGIASSLADETSGTLLPWITSPGGANPVRLFVASAEATKARELIEAYEKGSE